MAKKRVFAAAIVIATASCASLVGDFELGPEGSSASSTSGSPSGSSGALATSSTRSSSSTTGGAGGDGMSTSTSGARSSSGGNCGDTTANPKNCGSCGHDCLGGACVGGQCQKVVMATGQRQPSSIAVDHGHIYWTNYSGLDVRSLPKTADTSATPFVLVSNTPSGLSTVVTDGTLTTDAQVAYYATWSGGMFSVNVDA